jgi:hypothetical protein
VDHLGLIVPAAPVEAFHALEIGGPHHRVEPELPGKRPPAGLDGDDLVPDGSVRQGVIASILSFLTTGSLLGEVVAQSVATADTRSVTTESAHGKALSHVTEAVPESEREQSA